MGRNLILVELNEVPFRVLDAFRTMRPGSALSRLMAVSTQYETLAADRIALDPWISWPTLHRGVNDEAHEILHLGQHLDATDARYPPIWQILRAHGLRVGVFGSLHSSTLPANVEDYSFYLPDYFGSSIYCQPPQLMSFQELNLEMTRESARNVARRIPIKALLRFFVGLPSLGVKPSTLADASLQLFREILDKSTRIRRRSYQPLIMMDIFVRQLERSRPNFATFYTNHVAAAMHRYWGALFPQDYAKGELDDAWIERYRHEIPFAMDKLDAMIGRLLHFVHKEPSYVLMVASSMGQAAISTMQTYEFLTIVDPGRFLHSLGVPVEGWQFKPAMVPCCCVSVDEQFHATLLANIQELEIAGSRFRQDRRPVGPMSYDVRENGFVQFFVQFDNYAGPSNVSFRGKAARLADMGLGMMPHEDGVNCTAQHVSEGSLWVYDATDRSTKATTRTRISVLDVAPSILSFYGIERPAYMSGSESIGISAGH